MASSRQIVLTINSCEDLTTSFRNPIKKNAVAFIRVPHASQSWSTTVNKDGGAFPWWNEKFEIDMPVTAGWIEVEVRCGMETVIGTVKVPVGDFLDGVAPEGFTRFLSYRLRERNGAFNGVVNLAIRVVGRKWNGGNDAAGDCSTGPVYGVPVSVVTGIPVYGGLLSKY